jgi:hypothetical protein
MNNRIAQHIETAASESTVTVPQVPSLPSGFAFCPNHAGAAAITASAASFLHQAAYQQALQEARDRAWRAFLEQALFSNWN